jgi:hypothetical protein
LALPVTAVGVPFELPLTENGRICWALPNARSWRQQSLAFRIHVTAHSLQRPLARTGPVTAMAKLLPWAGLCELHLLMITDADRLELAVG